MLLENFVCDEGVLDVDASLASLDLEVGCRDNSGAGLGVGGAAVPKTRSAKADARENARISQSGEEQLHLVHQFSPTRLITFLVSPRHDQFFLDQLIAQDFVELLTWPNERSCKICPMNTRACKQVREKSCIS